jgi:hypothetical protein
MDFVVYSLKRYVEKLASSALIFVCTEKNMDFSPLFSAKLRVTAFADSHPLKIAINQVPHV